MKPLSKILAALLPLTTVAHTAQAEDTPNCQILIMEPLEVKDAPGEAMVASYFPATEFIQSAKDEAPEHISDVNGQKIRALMCTRNDVIPTESDYDFMATGIPFVLSQDFDSSDTDSLTLYWKDGQIEHVYKGHPLSDEAQAILDTRLAEFSKSGVNAWAREMAAKAAAEAAIKDELMTEAQSDRSAENKAATQFEETDVINTARTTPLVNVAQDEFDAADAQEISLGSSENALATRLNTQTKN